MNNTFENNWILEEYIENIEHLSFILQKESELLKVSKPLDAKSLQYKEMLTNLMLVQYAKIIEEKIFQKTSSNKYQYIHELAQKLLELNTEVHKELEKSIIGTQRLIDDIKQFVIRQSNEGYNNKGDKPNTEKSKEIFLAVNDKI